MYNYVVTALESTATTHSEICNFMGSRNRNLIVAKNSRVEIYELSRKSIVRRHFFDVYGTVISIKAFPRQETSSSKQSQYLFVLTQRNKFFVLSYDKESKRFLTKSAGNAQDRVGREVQMGTKVAMSPCGRVLSLHIYDGLIKILPIQRGQKLGEAYNTRIDELKVVDMVYLHQAGSKRPLLCLLYREVPVGEVGEASEETYIKTYSLDLKGKELMRNKSSEFQTKRADRILAVPFGGVLVVSDGCLEYFSLGMAPSDLTEPSNSTTTTTTSTSGTGDGSAARYKRKNRPKPDHYRYATFGNSTITAIGRIDNDRDAIRNGKIRYLLSDIRGSMYIVVVTDNPRQILTQHIGHTSIASTISYLDSSIVYVGSSMGDSQLVKLCQNSNENGSNLDILETFTNVGPIIDMVSVDLQRHGQCKLITCSGAHSDGTLRVVSNGIGFEEHAEIELSGIKGMWSLRDSFEDPFDTMLVQSFVGETRILGIKDEEMDEVNISGFDESSQTLFCGNVKTESCDDAIVQVTSSEVRLLSVKQGLKQVFSLNDGSRVIVAAGTPTQLVLGLNDGVLVYLEIHDLSIREVKRVKFKHEIACIDATPLGDDDDTTTMDVEDDDDDEDMSTKTQSKPRKRTIRASLVAVALWTDISVHILELPTLRETHVESLRSGVLPRSLVLSSLDGTSFLLVGLADGHLDSFCLDRVKGALHDHKNVLLGRNPIVLKPFDILGPGKRGRQHVFACCDRPMVIHSKKGMIEFVNVNTSSEVTFMSPFNTKSFPGSLAIASETTLSIGNVDNIQKLHVETVHLNNEEPRRIAYQASTRTVCVCTHRRLQNSVVTSAYTLPSVEQTFGFVQVFSTEGEMRKMGSFRLDPFETAISVCTITFRNDEKSEYYVVGTAYIVDGEEEPSKGRILVFTVRTDLRKEDEDEDAMDEEKEEEEEEVVNQLVKVCDITCAGAPYSLHPFKGHLVAGINADVVMFEWIFSEEEGKTLKKMCQCKGHFISLVVRSRGDHIAVADLMKSIRVLKFNSETQTLTEIARDCNCNWMCALACLSNDTFLGAEDNCNIFSVALNRDAKTEEEMARLLVVGEYHLGDSVNKICEGSLVMQAPEQKHENEDEGVSSKDSDKEKEENDRPCPRLIFGTVSGMIGVVISLPESDFNVLKLLQKAMKEVIKGIGGLSHSEWRSFSNDYRKMPKVSTGFIDGDLVELFLDPDVTSKTRDKIMKLVNKDGKNALKEDEVFSLVRKLSRMH